MHRLTAFAALVLACTLAFPASASAEAEGATIDKTGWWNRANTPTATPAGPITAPPPPGVPAGDLTVGRIGTETTAIAAVGIQPDEQPGATVERFTLTLREDPDASANRSTEEAAILACPITSFWAGGDNGAWDTRPEHDCDVASAPGQRGEDGTWTFDLAAIGDLWFDTFGTIRADGVALVPDPAAEASSFRVVWLGGEAIDVLLEATPGAPADDPFANPSTPADPPADVGLSSGPSGGSSSLFSPPRVASSPTIPPAGPADIPAAAPTAEAPADLDEAAAAPVASERPRTSRAGDLVGNWPVAGFVLVPLLLAVLLATSYWLGPAGQPATVDRRGGVSRALAARGRTAQER